MAWWPWDFFDEIFGGGIGASGDTGSPLFSP